MIIIIKKDDKSNTFVGRFWVKILPQKQKKRESEFFTLCFFSTLTISNISSIYYRVLKVLSYNSHRTLIYTDFDSFFYQVLVFWLRKDRTCAPIGILQKLSTGLTWTPFGLSKTKWCSCKTNRQFLTPINVRPNGVQVRPNGKKVNLWEHY